MNSHQNINIILIFPLLSQQLENKRINRTIQKHKWIYVFVFLCVCAFAIKLELSNSRQQNAQNATILQTKILYRTQQFKTFTVSNTFNCMLHHKHEQNLKYIYRMQHKQNPKYKTFTVSGYLRLTLHPGNWRVVALACRQCHLFSSAVVVQHCIPQACLALSCLCPYPSSLFALVVFPFHPT